MSIFLILLGVTTLVFLPFFTNSTLLLERNNDLQQQFWPVFYYIRENFITHLELPLWNSLIAGGLPILPDPQFSLFYPPNILFLVFPTDIAFLAHIFLHTLLASYGIFYLTRHAIKFSKWASLFASVLYILNPTFISFFEAGHYTLIAAYSWLPLVFASIVLIISSHKFKYGVILSLALAGLFYTHTLIFLWGLFFAGLLWLLLIIQKRGDWKILTTVLFLSVLLTTGLIVVTLIPQIEWYPITTRSLLLSNPDVYPKWKGLSEFGKSIFVPSSETEKIINFGIVPLFLAFYGFLKLKKLLKIIFLAGSFLLFIIILNNLSPFDYLLIEQDWFLLTRVATRIWVFFVLVLTLMAAYGITFLVNRRKQFFLIIGILALVELILWDISIIYKRPPLSNFVSNKVFDYINSDKEKFRVFCVSRCISAKEAAKRNVELVEGYNTLHQQNYLKQSWKLMGGYWNYFTLSIPPFGAYLYDKIQPSAKYLGEFNTKYVISPYQLNDPNFVPISKIDDFQLFKNNLYLPRATMPISIYTPNLVRIDTSKSHEKAIILRDIYSPGWKAYLDGTIERSITETPNALRSVNIEENTTFVDFKYAPNNLIYLQAISVVSYLSAGIYLLIKSRRN